MNLRDAKKLQTGAIVRVAYRSDYDNLPAIRGIVIGTKRVEEKHHAKILCQWKKERYDVVVHWMCAEDRVPRQKWDAPGERLQVRESWELMVVSHTS